MTRYQSRGVLSDETVLDALPLILILILIDVLYQVTNGNPRPGHDTTYVKFGTKDISGSSKAIVPLVNPFYLSTCSAWLICPRL